MYMRNRTLNKPKKPARKDWHRADIVAAVRKTGTNLQQLSLQHGLADNTLRQAVYRPYPKCERIIATHLGVKPETIWPSRYNNDGTPKSGRGERGIGRHPSNLKSHGSTGEETRNVYNMNMSTEAV